MEDSSTVKTAAEKVRTLPQGAVGFSLSSLEKVQKVLSLATGLSLLVATPDGKYSSHYSHPDDQFHSLLLDSTARLVKQLGSEEPGFRVVSLAGQAHYLVHPVSLEGRLTAFAIGGPYWPEQVSGSELENLALEFRMTQAEVQQALQAHPTPLHVDLDRAEDMMAALAELAEQTIRDQNQQARNLSTLGALYEVGTAISSSIRLEEVLKKVLDHAISLLGAENGSLMLLDEVKSELKMLVAQGLDERIVSSTRVTLGEGISGWVAQEGQARLLRKGIKDAASKTPRPEAEMKSAMCVPLKVKDRCIGVLNLSGRLAGDDFSQEDLKILTILASHAASAIDNAQLYEQVKRQVGELEALYHLGKVLNSVLTLEEILPVVLDQTIGLFGAEAAALYLVRGQELELSSSHGPIQRSGLGVARQVAATKKPVVVARSRELGRRSNLCVPLLTSDKVVAVLDIRGKLDGSDFSQPDLDLANQLASVAALAMENASLHDELHHLFLSSISALANAIDARDPYTKGHSERVTAYSVMLGQDLGLTGEELDELRYAALLHDIGKIRIRDHILHKPGRLTEEEFEEMKKHPQYGVEIMEPVRAFRQILPFMLHHHERFSGGGYPDGLRSEDIPFGARIMCVADCFDAMTSDRPYRRGMPKPDALAELSKHSGSQFDPRVVEAFLKLDSDGELDSILEDYREQADRHASDSA